MTGGPELAETAAALRLVLGRLVRRLRAVSPSDLTPSQVSALVTLEERGPLRLRDLAAHEGVRPPTATRLVDGLVEQGSVARSSDPTDARGTLLTLTDLGRTLLTTQRAERAAALTSAMARLPEPSQRRLREAVPALEALLAALRDPELVGAAG